MLILVMLSILSNSWVVVPAQEGISCLFKEQKLVLAHRMRSPRLPYGRRNRLANRKLDTLSNWYSPSREYVEIIRQDAPEQAHLGIAIGFEFVDTITAFPYQPKYAKLQLKNFLWGGVAFSRRDSSNYSGVSDAISDDLSIEVEGFQNDTIFGRFSGLLLSGAGPMAPIDSGYFRAFIYRRE